MLAKEEDIIIGHLPNKRSWIEAVSRATGRTYHTYLYSKAKIIKKVIDSGFLIIKNKRYGFISKNLLAYFLLRFKEGNKFLRLLTKLVYWLDNFIFSKLFPLISQNHLLVIQKPL